MRIRRRHRRAAMFALVTALYVAAIYFFVQAYSGDVPTSDVAALPNGGATAHNSPGFVAEPTAPPASVPTVASTSPAARSGESGTGRAVDGGTLPATTITAAEPGGLVVVEPSGHQVTLRVTAAGTIARLGYLVPTSKDHSQADMHNVKPPFVLRTQALGKPAYAQVFIQTDGSGVPITCTIAVDGKVTSRETTSGIYGVQVCTG